LKCKKIPFVTPKPTTTTTTTTTTSKQACKSEQTACMSDTTCGGIVSRDESKGTDKKECAANELCRKLMECHSPCFGKFVDCEANQACAAVLPNPEGDSEPSAAEIRKCASNPLCKEILKCNKIPVPKPVKTCYSVGDPHFKTFAGAVFDSHNPGWKPMYSKGDLQIELNQLQFVKNRPVPNNGPAVNAAIKYTVDGGNNWETRTAGELLGPNKNQPELYFAQFDVKLKVVSRDYSRFAWAQQATFYDVWITTSEYDGAKGQCVEGRLRRLGESSGGVFFPANPKVTKDQAKEACASLGSQMDNCMTDIRLVDEPEATSFIAKVFVETEKVEKQVEKEAQATNTPATGSSTTTSPAVTTTTSPAVTTTPSLRTTLAVSKGCLHGLAYYVLLVFATIFLL